MDNKVEINVNDEFPKVDIKNIEWGKYSQIMIAIETTIELIKNNEPLDISYEPKRLELIRKYENLLNLLKSKEIPHKGVAESLDQNVINFCLKNK